MTLRFTGDDAIKLECRLCGARLTADSAHVPVIITDTRRGAVFRERLVPGFYCRGCCAEAARQSLELFDKDPVRWRMTWQDWAPELAAKLPKVAIPADEL